MADKCPNCDKPVLDTDIICWHCGYQLPKRQPAKGEGAKQTGAAARARFLSPAGDAETAEVNLRMVAIYGLLTLAVILALWLVMRSLSRQPILVRSAAFELGDWVSVTDFDLRYTLSLPSDWQWLDTAFRDQSDLLAEVAARQPYVGWALLPLGGAAGDMELLGLAVGTRVLETADPIPFVVIGRSEELSALSPADALARLTGTTAVTEQAIDTRVAGQPQARFTVLDMPNAYQCRHLFTPFKGEGYLLAACAPQGRFGTLQHDLADILDSFQLLEN